MSFDASRAIHSNYGKILLDGDEQSNYTECTAKVGMDKKEINAIGDDWTRHKKGTKKGTGSVSGYKVTSAMIERGFDKFEIIAALEDPEAYGYERIRLKNCMADEISLINLKAGELVTEDTPFTFEGYELLDKIDA
ncbi:phage tail tube protein [Clostridium beijerinckii]|jgi:Protein of unknown function (DUF2001).|uniref:phage tail tube protein n=1 Tax=Clostridium beijerinckii TaxID=1520 RepID=UPI001360BF3A|nr:phage tail tube protein [Clostridium beijerinckii]MZK53678.1 phage portal protein [Clostridium beijerinckii]MZK61807.1 phage portal protein [Clostridium beijerinckii]MZK71988.1 phage portal protein [Clostridium beijerinckii]MZK77381.1 phage portal protein [Clostridium beijerinckii]MZK86959.1 phage portal protein [Clostridium beijerinckii]